MNDDGDRKIISYPAKTLSEIEESIEAYMKFKDASLQCQKKASKRDEIMDKATLMNQQYEKSVKKCYDSYKLYKSAIKKSESSIKKSAIKKTTNE